MSSFVRTADPYGDLEVIDVRAPRFNQTVVGIGSAVAVLSGFWPILTLLAAQLGIGLRFGRRYCLPCVAYFEFVQPRIGEGRIEDSRPPKFANQIGFSVLSASTLAYLIGLPLAGAALGTLVASLALLAAATGFCLGCQIYRLRARLAGVRRRRFDRVDLAELGVADQPSGEVVVSFGHPLCSDCQELEAEVRASGRPFVSVDVRARPRLARKYGVALVPTAVTVAPDGTVVARLAG
jgi:uncharacterized protein DUF4395